MQDSPLVSVVMPTYNDGLYLSEAIVSVLNQTYRNFEFIIVDDGSTDNTEQVADAYTDSRIRYLKNERNRGNTFTRNRGMAEARGEYVAIMDSDDIMHPERLYRQISYLQEHKEIDFVGCTVVRFSGKEWHYYQYFPHDPGYIRTAFRFRSIMLQPSITFRRESLLKHGLRYDESYPVGGDYRLFYTSAEHGLAFSSLEQPLLYYRVSDSQISRMEELHRHDGLIKSFFRERMSVFDLQLDEGEWETFYRFVRTRVPMDRNKYVLLYGIFDFLDKKNRSSRLDPPMDFRAALFFFRLRLIKYEFLEKGKKLRFGIELARLIMRSGMGATYKFWNNEGKYLGKSGERHKHSGPPAMPGF